MGRYTSLLLYLPVLAVVGWMATRYQAALGLFLIAHGLVHILYVVPEPAQEPGATEWPFNLESSWLLSNLGEGMVRNIGIALLVVTVVGFVVAGIALVADQGWWLGTAGVSVAASMLLLALFFHPLLVYGFAINAFMFSVAFLRWPATSFVGA